MEYKKINIILGRFQPFTRGHLKMIENGFRENGLPTVILQISNVKFDKSHPFSNETTKNEISNIINNVGNKLICDHFYISNASIEKIANICHDNGYEPVLWVTGTDRFIAYSKQADNEKYKTDNCLLNEFKCLEVKRTDDDISATKVREAIFNDDIETYYKLMPECVSGDKELYENLKNELLKIN